MDKIITHMNVDLDASLSRAAARAFIQGAMRAETVFLPANWNGEGVEGELLILDMDAGGKGIKGSQEADGRVHSCFKHIVDVYAPTEDQKALAPLVRYVDTHDTFGASMDCFIPEATSEIKEMFEFLSLANMLSGLKHKFSGPEMDRLVCMRMEEIFKAFLVTGRARIRAKAEAYATPLLFEGRIAILDNPKHTYTSGILFKDYGVRVIIYVNGHSIGILKNNDESLSLTHPEICRLIIEAGEVEEWFAHPDGWLYCRGSRKAPALTPSNVDPIVLAETIARILDQEEGEKRAALESLGDSLSRL